MAGLKVCLKRQAVAPGCGVSRAFLNAQALLFGGYRDALQSHEDGELWFSEELFLDHKSSSMRQFLQGAVHLQFFKQFIDSRLDILNKGKEPDDLFEEEIQKCETTAGKSKSYQQLVGNLKKGGGALILNMKSKANIKAKGLTKSGLKNLLIHKAHNEEPTLQRGGSVSHRRAQSDCLQNRLPITQHFGKSRPRRPFHKHKATRGEQDETDADDSWNGAPSEPVVMPEPHKVEEEGEDSLLCDPEEMDLLGEIFDTLSSRSSHDRGLLYGTRSLDLFGLDSHDYIMKRDFPANPSQESLSLSISGSGSLHSWNLETTEEHSDLTEDSDWLSLNASVPEEERTELLSAVHEKLEQSNGQKEDEEKQEEAKVAIDGEGAEDSRNCKEGETEEEKDRVSHEKRVSPGEDSDEREEEESKEKKEVEEIQMEEELEGQETDRTDEMLKDLKEEQQGGKDQEDNKTTDSLKVIELTPPRHSTGEEQPRQEDPTAAASRSLTADSEPPADRESRHDEAKDLQEKRETPPPKVLSAVARFQSQALMQGFQVKTRAKELAETRRPDEKCWYRENVQTHSNTSGENQCSEEEEPSLIKVSELKKRFEA